MSTNQPPKFEPPAIQDPSTPTLTPGEVFPGSISSLDRYFRNKADAEQELWAATMRTAIKADPALYAEADKLALDQGVTVDFALRNIDNVRRMARVKQMRDDRIEATNPSWYRSMQSLEFARKAWDDDQLPFLERWSRAYESGQLITERGRIAARAMFTKGTMSPDDSANLERIQKRQGELGPVSGFFPSAVEIIGQQSKSIPEALAAGAAGGGAAALAASFTGPGAGAAFVGGFKAAFWSTLAVNAFEVEAGNAYADMIQAGYDPDRSWNAAFGIGLANAALEMGGASLATGGLRREVGRLLTRKALEESAKATTTGFARGFLKEYAKGVGGEVATELMQELVNIAGEEAARRPGDASLSPEGIASRLWEVASKTTQGMAILGIPNAAAGGNRARVAAMVQKAQQDAEKLREAVKAGAQSPLTKNDPAAAEQFMEQTLAENGTPRTVFVDAAMLRDVLAQADKAATEAGDGLTKSAGDILESIVPGITEQIEDQAAQGGDVQVPTAKLITTIAQQLPKVAEALNEHGRMDPALPSAAVAAEMQKEVEAQAKQADTGTDAEKAFRESLAKVEEQVAGGFTETATALRPAEVKASSRVVAEMVATIAEGEKVTPEQVWKDYGAAFATHQAAMNDVMEQPERGGFIRRALAWLYSEKSDVSTAIHEPTHWYTEVVDRIAQRGSPWAVEQMNVLLDRWKLTREQWDAMPDAERAKHYEDISYNAEEYFATGQAPSKELAGVFEKLRKFILRVYSNVIKSFGSLRGGLEASYREQFGRDLPAMTPELRGFFDRMLASEQAIEIVQAEREGAVAFDKAAAKSLGLDDATMAEVERLQQEAKDEAKAKLSAEAVRGARYFQAARRGAEKDAKAQLRAAEERVRKEVEEEFRDNPAQNAYRYLRDGIYETADGDLVKDKSARKLSSVVVRRILGLPAIKGGEKGTSLVGRIRQLGGIRLDSYPGEIKGEFSIPGVFRKEGGQSWEAVAQQLASEGYGGEVYDGDVAQSVDNMWLVDALTAAAQGERRYADEAVTESSRMQAEYQDWLRTQSADADQAVREAKASAAEREAMFTKLARRGLVQKSEAQQIRDAYAEARRKVNGRKLSAEEMRQVRESTEIVEGSDPDQIGALFGFQTGDEMLRALANMQLREEAIRRRVRQRIEAEEPLADPKKMRQAVEAATHGKAAARLASTILRAMLNNTRSTAELEAAAQQAAKAVLARTPVGQISVRGFSQAELRAAKAAREALKSGKVDEAIEAQRKHLLQHYLTRFAVDIEKELDKFNDTVGGSYMKPDADILKAKRDLDRVQAIRSILGKYEAIGTARAEAANAYLGTMANQNPTGHAELSARIVAATTDAKPWRLVPLDRWRQVMEETAQLWHESKRSEQVRIAGVMRQRQEVQEELEAQLVDVFGDPSGKAPKPTTTDWDPATWLASVKRLESLALALDGGKVGGPWQRYVYRTLKDAQTERDAEMLVEREWYRDHLEKHGDLTGPKYDGKRWLGDTFSTFQSRAQIVGMLYHLGTDGNFRNMAVGNGWAWQKDGELYAHNGQPFVPVFQDMLRDMVERGYLRKEDFDLAQAAFDHIRDRLKTRLFDTSREVWGFYPKEVEAMPFDTPFGKYPGGYFPSKVDKANSNLGAKAQLDAVSEMRTDFVANHGNVPRGMTIARQAGAKQPRVMDVRLLWDHIADTLQIIHLAGPTKDIAGLFRTGTLQESLRIADRNALPYVILPAIDRAARGKIVAQSDPGLLRFSNYVKQATSTMFLGLNPRNAAQQLTGLSNAALYSSIPEVWAAFWKFSRNPAKAVAAVEQFSEAMRIRWSTEMQALAADIEQMFAPSTIGKVQNVATRWAFVMQRYMQMTTDAIAWSAAFEHHLPSVGEAEAVARADQAVRLSQGEKSPLDVPRALAGGAVAQLFTQFADYPNVVLNSVLSPPDGRRFAAVMLALVTPTLASSLIALAFAGGRLGKGARSDDDTPEEIMAKLVGDQIKGAFSMIPALGSAVGGGVVALIDTMAEAAFGERTPKLGGETQLRNSPFAAQALLETVQRLAAGSASPRDVAAFAALLTKLPLMPFGNAFNYMERVDEGKSRPANALDYGRGLIMGR